MRSTGRVLASQAPTMTDVSSPAAMKAEAKALQGDIKFDYEWSTLGGYLEFLERRDQESAERLQMIWTMFVPGFLATYSPYLDRDAIELVR